MHESNFTGFMNTKNYKIMIKFHAEPSEVYEVLMDSQKHAKFTGAPAEISTKTGGKFSLLGGYITGVNLELKKNKLIVLKWRAKPWHERHFSRVMFRIKPDDVGTKMSFYHTWIPQDEYESIKAGWEKHYWEPMKKMLNKEIPVVPQKPKKWNDKLHIRASE